MSLIDFGRALTLADYDLDYSDLDDAFKNLLDLAATITGMPISMISLVDDYTQWAISSYGMHIGHVPRQDSVCHYTVQLNVDFEVSDLAVDDRFCSLEGIAGEPGLKYYFGTPVRSADGRALGALCVLDLHKGHLSEDKMQALHTLAHEVSGKLDMLKVMSGLNRQVDELTGVQKKIAHDIRGPVGGIVGLADIICSQGKDNSMAEVLEFAEIIRDSGTSILELAHEIMSNGKVAEVGGAMVFDQRMLKEKLERLFALQARNKGIRFRVVPDAGTQDVKFRKDMLLQILGNIIGNSIRFTSSGGEVTVRTAIDTAASGTCLVLDVEDTGVGMEPEQVHALLSGASQSTSDTDGKMGYGFGFGVAREMVGRRGGSLEIKSVSGEGTTVRVCIPL